MNKKEVLFDALTGVEPEYLKEADGSDFNRTVSKRPMRWAAAAAACLTLGAAFGIVRTASVSVTVPPNGPAMPGTETERPAEGISPGDLAKLETYPELPGEPSAIYYSIGDMINDADCIALVEVIDSRIEYTETIPGWPVEPTTYTEINFIEVYKGAEQPGEGTEVVEMGGFQDGHLLGDYPQLMKNGRYVLFMQHTDGGCSICGAFQGRFIVRDGFVIQQRTEDVGLEDYTPVSLNEFKQLIGK